MVGSGVSLWVGNYGVVNSFYIISNVGDVVLGSGIVFIEIDISILLFLLFLCYGGCGN